MSGPAVLQVSNYWKKGEPVTVDLLPEINVGELLLRNRSRNIVLGNFLASVLPKRFVELFIPYADLPAKPLDQLSQKDIERVSTAIGNWRLEFSNTEGYDRAEVTLGGVSTDELSSKTMESRKVSGLFFIGEVVYVTGWLCGYNFQWAWSSAFAAGNAI
jgi:predicted Rossmann fold flavoprotein